VKSADQILVLQDGRIVERGRHSELLRKDGTYRQIYDLELRDQEEALHPVPAAAEQVIATAAGS
jgi:ABC-type hemin transport system ATPase subunit